MEIINYISNISIPIMFLLIIVFGVKEKINVYELFIKGVKEGIKIVIKIFPTLLAIFIAIGMLRSSGIIECCINGLRLPLDKIGFPIEVLPLALLKPISGSASMVVATNIMKEYGVDTCIGRIASTIMGSTETTLYVISIYTSCIKIKQTRNVLLVCLLSDFIGIITAIFICKII